MKNIKLELLKDTILLFVLIFFSCLIFTSCEKTELDQITLHENTQDTLIIDDSVVIYALWHAINNNKEDMVKYLVEDISDLNFRNNYGQTPLFLASIKGNINIVNTLIENGANVNMANPNGITPLIISSVHNHFHIVKLLLENGADPYLTDYLENDALHYAVIHNHTDIADLLN